MSIFVDFEMNTTDRRMMRTAKLRQEIIEIGAVRMDEKFHPVDRERIFVCPQFNGVVERRIYKLTGIENGAVNRAVALQQALEQLCAWAGEDSADIYAWSPNDKAQLRKECAYKHIATPLLTDASCWHDFQEEFSRIIREPTILSLSNAMKRAGIAPQGNLHDASWDAYNSACLMEVACTSKFAKEIEEMWEDCCNEVPKAQGGLPRDVMEKLASLLQEEQ